MFVNVSTAPPIIAGTRLVIFNDMNTNGVNVRNNNRLVKTSSLKLFNTTFIVNPIVPARYPNSIADIVVIMVIISIHNRNIAYLLMMNVVLDVGAVSMVFSVCSLYSLPNRYDIMIVNSSITNIRLVYIFTWLKNVSRVMVSVNSPNLADRNNRNEGNIAPSSVSMNIFDLLSFMNSISIKLYIFLSPLCYL